MELKNIRVKWRKSKGLALGAAQLKKTPFDSERGQDTSALAIPHHVSSAIRAARFTGLLGNLRSRHFDLRNHDPAHAALRAHDTRGFHLVRDVLHQFRVRVGAVIVGQYRHIELSVLGKNPQRSTVFRTGLTAGLVAFAHALFPETEVTGNIHNLTLHCDLALLR